MSGIEVQECNWTFAVWGEKNKSRSIFVTRELEFFAVPWHSNKEYSIIFYTLNDIKENKNKLVSHVQSAQWRPLFPGNPNWHTPAVLDQLARPRFTGMKSQLWQSHPLGDFPLWLHWAISWCTWCTWIQTYQTEGEFLLISQLHPQKSHHLKKAEQALISRSGATDRIPSSWRCLWLIGCKTVLTHGKQSLKSWATEL